MQTYHIHINGIVQGVGFRPMINNVASEMQITGYVKNGSDGVHVFFNASRENADMFFKKIIGQAPKLSIITAAELTESGNKIFESFSIVVGDDNNKKDVLISPDNSICASCKRELHDKNNFRFRYPFITCTQCGPRYSIMDKLPYERHNSSMQKFTMCEKCNKEYDDLHDRRFFSQTNSCADCGVALSMYRNASTLLLGDVEDILRNAKKFFSAGKIIAIKGIGGYLLMCDANNEDTIQLLRARKGRPAKPFAVLYPDMKSITEDFLLNPSEAALLESKAAPIILLYLKDNAYSHISINDVAPQLRRTGVMLPYSPLLELIAADYGKPLIATSGNISGSPIIYKDEDALGHMFNIADYLIVYNREIVIPEDDSVLQVSKFSNQQIILRRSRGYAPSYLGYKQQTNLCILSTGAYLKSTFTLTINGRIFVSQFLGNGDSFESQQMFKNTLMHWMKLYNTKPFIILADKHLGYFSHQYALEIAEKNECKIKFIQHHKAHLAAVLGENNLLREKEAILGIIWDGTGLGDDMNIWGGEFFKYENCQMQRCVHFAYFPVIAGDKMALEPRISALCALGKSSINIDFIKEKFSKEEWKNYLALIASSKLFTSSTGRIFDAVASLLNVCNKQSYEGEAAMYLQALAEDYVEENGFKMDESYFKNNSHNDHLSTSLLMEGIVEDLKLNKSRRYIAAKFHYSLVSCIDAIAQHLQIKIICFSGGVFQNGLLTDWIQKMYNKKYRLFFHRNLSPNDENISFGQMVYYDNSLQDTVI